LYFKNNTGKNNTSIIFKEHILNQIKPYSVTCLKITSNNI